MLGLPIINVAALSLVAFASSLESAVPLLLVAAVLALAELVLLVAQSSRYRVGVSGVLAAMLGNAVMTTLGFLLVLFVALVLACHGSCDLS